MIITDERMANNAFLLRPLQKMTALQTVCIYRSEYHYHFSEKSAGTQYTTFKKKSDRLNLKFIFVGKFVLTSARLNKVI
jgi:hypothetical protein